MEKVQDIRIYIQELQHEHISRPPYWQQMNPKQFMVHNNSVSMPDTKFDQIHEIPLQAKPQETATKNTNT